MALLEMDLPPIELHASTQTHNYEPERIRFLDQIGFSRIVLARELSLEQVAKIRSEISAEIEYFVHGALCVSLSGQCYMSQSIGGRSANRGDCAQACRLPYNVSNAEGQNILQNKHVLSLNDLNLSSRISDLAQAGVQSFKIEGRLKDQTYVKNTVASYRKEIDKAIAQGYGTKASSGIVRPKFEPDLERSFNRNAGVYFLDGRQGTMANFDTPKSTGKPVGKVTRIFKDSIEVALSESLTNGDGLCIIAPDMQTVGFRANKVEQNRIWCQTPSELKIGATVYRNYDHQFEKITERSQGCRKIRAEISFYNTDNGFGITITDEDNYTQTYSVEHEKNKAEKPEKISENITNQLKKSGDTDFEITHVHILSNEIYFVPISVLNELRRKAIEQLTHERETSYQASTRVLEAAHTAYPSTTINYQGNVANKLAQQFYEKRGVESIEKAYELQKNPKDAAVMTTRYCLKFEMKTCPVHHGKEHAIKGPLFIEGPNGKFRLEFDCKRCRMTIHNA
jgi:putative protease